MVAWRYEISLLVLKLFHSFAQHSKRHFVSPRGHVITSISVTHIKFFTLGLRNIKMKNKIKLERKVVDLTPTFKWYPM